MENYKMENYERKSSSEYLDTHQLLLEDPTSKRQTSSLYLPTWRSISTFVLVTYTVVSVPILIWTAWNHIPKPYSPASQAVSYTREPLYFGEDPTFTGAPDDVDEAWDHLLEPLNIRTSKEEQEKAHAELNGEIVQVTDGGYVSVLSVYHELHCLDTLRRNMYYEHYYVNATDEEREYNILHMGHCIDTIRRSLMCKADPAIYTAYWIGNHTAIPSKELRSKSYTVCINWEALDSWARERLLLKDKYKVKPGPFESHHG